MLLTSQQFYPYISHAPLSHNINTYDTNTHHRIDISTSWNRDRAVANRAENGLRRIKCVFADAALMRFVCAVEGYGYVVGWC